MFLNSIKIVFFNNVFLIKEIRRLKFLFMRDIIKMYIFEFFNKLIIIFI